MILMNDSNGRGESIYPIRQKKKNKYKVRQRMYDPNDISSYVDSLSSPIDTRNALREIEK